jgi:hypothetical protein
MDSFFSILLNSIKKTKKRKLKDKWNKFFQKIIKGYQYVLFQGVLK